MKSKYLPIIIATTLGISAAGSTQAASLYLSTTTSATLGGYSMINEDVVDYDPLTDTASSFFNGADFLSGSGLDIDAFSVLADGHYVFSTTNNASDGSQTYGDDDLIEYNPGTNSLSLYMDGATLFSSTSEDINAVHVMDDGQLLLSTTSGATLGGLDFLDGDLVLYNIGAEIPTATLFLAESTLFSGGADIDAVAMLSNGNLLISSLDLATVGGNSLAILDGDLAEYNLSTGDASLFFSEGLFSADEDIDAVSAVSAVPVPAAVWLFGSGLIGMAGFARRKKLS